MCERQQECKLEKGKKNILSDDACQNQMNIMEENCRKTSGYEENSKSLCDTFLLKKGLKSDRKV